MICLACDELTKHKTQTIQKRVKQTVLDKIAPKDPTAKRPGFYVLLDKPVGGLPSNDGVGRHPVYINGDRLVTFAKMVGGIDDENILEMLRTAKGFRKLVHSVGVSIVGDLPDKVVTFTLGFSGELGSGGSRSGYVPVSEEVEAFTPMIQLYATEHGIPEYVEMIKAVMLQESGGQGTDPMQCSESGFNTRYPHAPNSITDPEYSIDVGVQSLAYVLGLAEAESPIDLERISLALQGYNYGSGYITWALANYGGYSELNAIEYSDMMVERMGWTGYGDKAYVSHVLRYYPIGRSFMGEGNAAMVAVAQSQIGSVGGEPYWSWWGLDYRVEWCAMFVSWCADQCGYLDSGVLPKMEGVLPFIDWFRERCQWQDCDYKPIPGDIIFFDWEGDGVADHVGIVEKVDGDFIYTIEGNTDDQCRENRYYLISTPIFGYGLPQY